MEDKIYCNEYILSYTKINNYLGTLCKKYPNKILKEKKIGKTTYGYDMNVYKIGNGKKHVIMIGATHGCELVTVYFILDFIFNLVLDEHLYQSISHEFTFHIIPVLNPEGYMISSSNVLFNINPFNQEELEKVATIYLEKYNLDDEIAKKGIKKPKHFTSVLRTSTKLLPNLSFQKSIEEILYDCHLTTSYLPVWTANGVGIDPNSNSIHKFDDMIQLRCKQKFANLRYNDIPVTRSSPMSFPGCSTFQHCPENFALYQYIMKLYRYNKEQSTNDQLIAIFSYHSTGGEIYGYPEKALSNSKQQLLHEKAMQIYASYTNYTPIDEKLKYGVMDFYRVALENVFTLTIELSKLNGNPIGPYANIASLQKEIIHNKIAVIETIKEI